MNKSSKIILVTAAIFGILGVVLGAFAAHGLRTILTEAQLESFQTGVRYQFYHAFLLLFVGVADFLSAKQLQIIWMLTLTGVVLFSGSIYILNLDEYIIGTNVKAIVFATPIGGVFLIAAWSYMLMSLLKISSE
ncbi:DUF423 domain-containing protein [Aquimarina agarivorans]|uniref:DUF423 domain-containing protein n=1 Tax=Aquimarina agarivorans TaxID=980584 RepID=UPI000248E717|nr:DUF423 domain-containing protein [Aquimarina agarivorans]